VYAGFDLTLAPAIACETENFAVIWDTWHLRPPWLIVSHRCVRYYFTMDLPSAVAVVTVRLFPRAHAVAGAEIAIYIRT